MSGISKPVECGRCHNQTTDRQFYLTMNYETGDKIGYSEDIAISPTFCLNCARQIINEIEAENILEWIENKLDGRELNG